MKKITSLLLCVCLLLCLAACHENTEQPQESESNTTTESHTSTESTENNQDEDADTVKVLTLEKALYTYYEWADDYDQALVRSEHSCVTLGQADADAYPEMAQVLSQIATMQENAMLDEFDSLVSFAREELDANRDGVETNVSKRKRAGAERCGQGDKQRPGFSGARGIDRSYVDRGFLF